MDAPPIINEDIEHREQDDEEGGGPLGFEAHRDHAARDEPEDRDEYPGEGPCTLEHEPQEQEDQQDAADELIANRIPPIIISTLSYLTI